MTRITSIPVLLLLGACAQPLPEPVPAPDPAPAGQIEAQPATVEAAEDEARRAALRWLGTVDAGEYRRSWDEGAALFRAGVTAEQWDQALRQARTPLGAVTSREPQEAQAMTQLPGAPEGEYMVLFFDTRFATSQAREQIVMTRDSDGQWRVIGYFVQP